jgi:hypothetical protein
MLNRKMTLEEFKEFMKAQRSEIDKYKWCLGEKLHHDPLIDRTYNDIGIEWINLYAEQFREEWSFEKDSK